MKIDSLQLYRKMNSFTGFFNDFAKTLSNFLEFAYLAQNFLIAPLPAAIASIL